MHVFNPSSLTIQRQIFSLEELDKPEPAICRATTRARAGQGTYWQELHRAEKLLEPGHLSHIGSYTPVILVLVMCAWT